ncbi:MAG: ATP-binding protein [bacterium]|nr:ATP-binding protein [bacterium]
MVLASALNQVWTNLIDNAIDAMKTSDTKVLTIDTKQSGQFINIDIKDSGSGIPDDVKDKIFDPFFTTKAVGEGTGLGLEVVHDIITKQHNGTVNVESSPGSTVFKICFPITQ